MCSIFSKANKIQELDYELKYISQINRGLIIFFVVVVVFFKFENKIF